jgi:hypothetical protein
LRQGLDRAEADKAKTTQRLSERSIGAWSGARGAWLVMRRAAQAPAVSRRHATIFPRAITIAVVLAIVLILVILLRVL